MKGFDSKLQMKEVIDVTNNAMSYFRKAQLVYRNFVNKLRQDERIIAEEEIVLEGFKLIPEGQYVKLMFYNDESGMPQMMIGIGRID